MADFERCLQLVGTDLREDQLIATLLAGASYYIWRADLRRTAQLLEMVQAGPDQGRRWFRPAIDGFLGMVAFFRGEYDAAASHLERATAGLPDEDEYHIEMTCVEDPLGSDAR
jgi:hypothetical protein